MTSHEALAEVIERYRSVPFDWGTNDCVLFVARCVDAQIGSNYEERIHAEYPYSSAVGAFRTIENGGGIEALVTRFLGAPVAPAALTMGDIVLAKMGDGMQLLGVCDEELFMFPSDAGLRWLPMTLATGGWALCRS